MVVLIYGQSKNSKCSVQKSLSRTAARRIGPRNDGFVLRFVAPMNFQDLSWSDWVHQVPSPDVGPWQPLAANRKCANALGRVIHSTLSFKMCSLFMGLVQNTRRLCKGGRLTLFMASCLHLHLLVLQFAGSNGRMCMLLVLNAWLVMV